MDRRDDRRSQVGRASLCSGDRALEVFRERRALRRLTRRHRRSLLATQLLQDGSDRFHSSCRAIADFHPAGRPGRKAERYPK